MRVAQLGRDDERPELAPHHLFAGEAEHPLGGGVELADAAPGVEDDHRVDGRLDDRELAVARALERARVHHHERPEDQDQGGAQERHALAHPEHVVQLALEAQEREHDREDHGRGRQAGGRARRRDRRCSTAPSAHPRCAPPAAPR